MKMELTDYLNFRIESLKQTLESKSGIVENDNIEDLRIIAQLSELTMLKKHIENETVYCC